MTNLLTLSFLILMWVLWNRRGNFWNPSVVFMPSQENNNFRSENIHFCSKDREMFLGQLEYVLITTSTFPFPNLIDVIVLKTHARQCPGNPFAKIPIGCPHLHKTFWAKWENGMLCMSLFEYNLCKHPNIVNIGRSGIVLYSGLPFLFLLFRR